MVPWWNWSLRQRLAVAICGSLAVGIIAFGIVAWNEVRKAAVEAAETRLEVVTRRIADLLSNSVSQQKSQVAGIARDRGIQHIAAGGGGPERDSAVSRFVRADSASPSILNIQIWNAAGDVLFSTSPPSNRVDNTARRDLLALLGPGDSSAIAPFRVDGDTIQYAVLGPIRRGARVTEWAVVWRRMSSADDSRSITDLIGTHANLSLGNTRGDAWSDMSAPTPPPPTPPAGTTSETFVSRDARGEKVLASRAAVVGSPWTVAIEFPYSEVVSPIMGLARRLAIFGAMLLLLGGLIAVWIARNLARPIGELARAAEGLRAGD